MGRKMGRKPKYSDDKLLEAVIAYANVFPGIIVVVELAEWADENIPELKGVQARHFLRPVQITNEKTGKVEIVEKACKTKIDEYNRLREYYLCDEENLIFSTAKVEHFFDLARYKQLECLQSARAQYLQFKKDAAQQKNEIDRLKKGVEHLEILTKELTILRKEIHQASSELSSNLQLLSTIADEEMRNHILKKSGIAELDLKKYHAYLQEKEGQLFSMQNLVNRYVEVCNSLPLDDFFDSNKQKDEIEDVDNQNENNLQNNINNLVNMYLKK